MSRKKKAVAGFAAALAFAAWLPAAEIVEAIVAIVNDDVITLSEYREQYETFYQAIRSQTEEDGFYEQLQQMRERLLDTMITNLLLLQEAQKQGINVNEQVRMTIENIKKEYSLETDADLIRAVEQQGNSFESWKSQLEEDILRQGVIYSEVRRTIVIDESDIVDYYRKNPEELTEPAEFSLRAILVSTEGRSAEDVEARKKEIGDKLTAGEDMAALAEQYSDGPARENQGDLGTFKQGDLAENLRDAVKDLEEGQSAPWLKVTGGWYLIKLEAKTPSRLKTFEESRRLIEETLYRALEREKLEGYIEDLKARSFIKILIPKPYESLD